jgi:hypothetical protein
MWPDQPGVWVLPLKKLWSYKAPTLFFPSTHMFSIFQSIACIFHVPNSRTRLLSPYSWHNATSPIPFLGMHHRGGRLLTLCHFWIDVSTYPGEQTPTPPHSTQSELTHWPCRLWILQQSKDPRTRISACPFS